MALAFGYCRISTNETKQQYSLEAQAEAIRRAFEYKSGLADHPLAKGVKLIEPFFSDQQSAKYVDFRKRIAGGELFGKARAGDHIIIAKADRAFRNIVDMGETLDALHKRGVTLHLLDLNDLDLSTPFGRLSVGLLVLIAEWESNRRSERVKEASRVKKFVRLITNHDPPYGWKWVKLPGKPSAPVPHLYERRLGYYCLDYWTAGKTPQQIAVLAKRDGHKLRRHRKSTDGQGLSADRVDTLIKAARYNFPLPAGAETGYIEVPKLDDMGRVMHKDSPVPAPGFGEESDADDNR